MIFDGRSIGSMRPPYVPHSADVQGTVPCNETVTFLAGAPSRGYRRLYASPPAQAAPRAPPVPRHFTRRERRDAVRRLVRSAALRPLPGGRIRVLGLAGGCVLPDGHALPPRR